MSDAPPNPRAFPSSAIEDRFGGMTLRDHFAGCALQGLMASEAGIDMPYEPHWAAERSYLMADAMLAQRPKQGDQT